MNLENKENKEFEPQIEKEQLNTLKQNILPGYSKEEIENYPGKEKGLIKDINLLERSLGKNFVDSFVKGQKIENQENVFETQKISLSDLEEIVEEIKILESQKSVETVESIILTTEELKEIEKILSSQSTREELNLFLEEQFKENVSSKEVFGKDNIDKFTKNFETKDQLDIFLKSMDNMFFDFLNEKYSYLSQDVTRNMATGITLALFEIYKDFSEDSKENFFQMINDFDFQKLEKNLSYKNKKFLGKIGDFFEILKNKQIKEKLQNGENNKILTNPYQFKNLFIEYIYSKNNKEKTKQKLIKSQDKGYKFEGLSEKESQDIQDMLGESIEKIDSQGSDSFEGILGNFENLKNLKGEMKEKVKQNGGVVLEILAAVPFLKDIVNYFLDFLDVDIDELQDSSESSKQLQVKKDLFQKYKENLEEKPGYDKEMQKISQDMDLSDEQKKLVNTFDLKTFKKLIKDYDFSKLDGEKFGKYHFPKSFLLKNNYIKEGGNENFDEEKVLQDFLKKSLEKKNNKNFEKDIDNSSALAYFLINEYVDLFENTQEEDEKDPKEWEKKIKSRNFEEFLSSKGKAFEKYKNEIINICEDLNIPKNIFLHLLIKEGSHGNTRISPNGSSAVGLGQITDNTREYIKSSLSSQFLDNNEIPKEWDRYNAKHQLKGSAIYLKEQYQKTGNWLDAVVSYHTGGGPSNDKEAKTWLQSNPAIAKNIPDDDSMSFVQKYNKGARKYYGAIV